MKIFNTYKVLICAFLFSIIYTESDYYYYYSLNEGANLLSFPLNNDNNSIETFFNIDNPNLISNYDMQPYIISIISEGEIGLNINNEWQGSLDEISTNKGYWLMLDEPISFLYTGSIIDENSYFLHPGSNLISFPFENEVHINDALPIYSQDILTAIIGQNESLLIYNNQMYGSLTHFKPGNGYWFIANDYSIFQYDTDENRSTQTCNITKDKTRGFNQSVVQSIFFTEKIYLSGQENYEELSLNIYCNDQLVGNKNWVSNYSDLIAMGSDGYEWTSDYCELNEKVTIKNNSEELYIIKGNNNWVPNNYSIITLSDANSGDLNYDNIINVVDIVFMVEHIIDTNNINNQHQLLLADLNQDEIINVADLIINVETIIND